MFNFCFVIKVKTTVPDAIEYIFSQLDAKGKQKQNKKQNQRKPYV